MNETYVIYEVSNERGENYIGLTRKTQATVEKSVQERWRKHTSRARNEFRKWNLYVYLKSGGLQMTWTHKVLAVVEGRKAAYALERTIIIERKPTLNDQYM